MRALLFVLSAAVALPLEAQVGIDTATMRSTAREFRAGCEAGARLWGQSLCGPMIIVDPDSRFAIATARPGAGEFWADGDLFAGLVPGDVQLANTAQEWAGQRWSFVLTPLPRNAANRRLLVFHESFHRIQPALGLAGPDRLNAHLDERDGRYWLRLELRALAVAVQSRGAPSRSALNDALLFRAVRQQQFPGADTLEAALERAEGLAEYTGSSMALSGRASDSAMAEAARAFERRPSYARALGYGTGPLMGAMLDRYRPDWRSRVGREGFGAQLAAAAGWKAPLNLPGEARMRALKYGGALIAQEEDGRAIARQAVREDYRRRLSANSVLLLKSNRLSLSFDPNSVVPMDSLGTVYPTGTFTAEWGTLEVTEGGALVGPMFNEVRVSAPESPARDGTIEGKGWRLQLDPAWKLAAGERAGDLTPVKAP